MSKIEMVTEIIKDEEYGTIKFLGRHWTTEDPRIFETLEGKQPLIDTLAKHIAKEIAPFMLYETDVNWDKTVVFYKVKLLMPEVFHRYQLLKGENKELSDENERLSKELEKFNQ